MNLAATVNRYSGAVTRRRYAAPVVVAGYATPGAATDTPVRALVVPAKGKDLERVREGLRQRVRFMAWTTADLRTVDQDTGLPPDELLYQGVRYQVASVGDYRMHGGFRELALLQVDA